MTFLKTKNNFKKKIKILLGIIISIIMLFLPDTDSDAKEYKSTYQMSLWNIWLYENQDVINIYNTMTGVYSDPELAEYETCEYPDELIIGLIANITSEGDPGVVEYAFSYCNQYGFELPSGGTHIKTMDDIDYLLEWTTSDEETEDGCVKKGSCGVSSVQWSYGRRIKWLTILKEHMENDGRTEVTSYDLSYADTKMLLTELKENGRYYRRLNNILKDVESPTAADYAEALCDVFFLPSECDLDYSNTGESCQARRKEAEKLWDIYTSETTKPYTITIID